MYIILCNTSRTDMTAKRGRNGGKELNKVTYTSLIPKRALYTSLFKGKKEKFCVPLPEKG